MGFFHTDKSNSFCLCCFHHFQLSADMTVLNKSSKTCKWKSMAPPAGQMVPLTCWIISPTVSLRPFILLLDTLDQNVRHVEQTHVCVHLLVVTDRKTAAAVWVPEGGRGHRWVTEVPPHSASDPSVLTAQRMKVTAENVTELLSVRQYSFSLSAHHWAQSATQSDRKKTAFYYSAYWNLVK